MPLYSLKNNETGEVVERFMSISAMEQYMEENPHMTHHYDTAPPILDPARLGVTKTPPEFRELLKHIDSRAGRHSKVNW